MWRVLFFSVSLFALASVAGGYWYDYRHPLPPHLAPRPLASIGAKIQDRAPLTANQMTDMEFTAIEDHSRGVFDVR